MNSEITVLLSTVSTGVLALLGLCLKYSYYSKCFRIKVSWCGCECERDIHEERDQVVNNLQTPTNNNTNNNTNNFSNV